MEKKRNLSTNIFASISLFFGLLGLILSFLPLRMFALIPAGIGIYFGVIAYILSRVFKIKKSFVYIVLAISLGSIFIASISEQISSNEIAEDQQFEQQLETSTKEDATDLSEAFEDEEEQTTVDSTISQPEEEFVEEEFVEETFEEEFKDEDLEDEDFEDEDFDN